MHAITSKYFYRLYATCHSQLTILAAVCPVGQMAANQVEVVITQFWVLSKKKNAGFLSRTWLTGQMAITPASPFHYQIFPLNKAFIVRI
jgi:hypothetical protein